MILCLANIFQQQNSHEQYRKLDSNSLNNLNLIAMIYTDSLRAHKLEFSLYLYKPLVPLEIERYLIMHVSRSTASGCQETHNRTQVSVLKLEILSVHCLLV